MSKICYFVFGPESSGNRLMARLLIAAGCWGDGKHDQRLDAQDPPADADRVVWVRSFPHAKRWPDIPILNDRMERFGFEHNVAVVMSRDWQVTAKSQVANGHVPNLGKALANIERAYHVILTGLEVSGLSYRMVNYESLIYTPQFVLGWLMPNLFLPMPTKFEPIRDGNRKYVEADK